MLSGALLFLLFILLRCCEQRGRALREFYLLPLYIPHLPFPFFYHVYGVCNVRLCMLRVAFNFFTIQCKHQLAARLAASTGTFIEVKVSDEELALLLSNL